MIREEYDLLVKGVFGPKREEIRGDVEVSNKEKIHDLYPAPASIRVIKSRGQKRVVHVASKGERRAACRILVEKPDKKKCNHLVS